MDVLTALKLDPVKFVNDLGLSSYFAFAALILAQRDF